MYNVRVNQPPGGRSSIDLGGGANYFHSSTTVSQPPGGRSSISLGDSSRNYFHSSTTVSQPPGGRSSISLGDGSTNYFHSSTTVSQPPGGRSSISLGDGSTNYFHSSTTVSQPPGGRSSIDLGGGRSHFHSSTTVSQPPGGRSSIQFGNGNDVSTRQVTQAPNSGRSSFQTGAMQQMGYATNSFGGGVDQQGNSNYMVNDYSQNAYAGNARTPSVTSSSHVYGQNGGYQQEQQQQPSYETSFGSVQDYSMNRLPHSNVYNDQYAPSPRGGGMASYGASLFPKGNDARQEDFSKAPFMMKAPATTSFSPFSHAGQGAYEDPYNGGEGMRRIPSNNDLEPSPRLAHGFGGMF